MHAQRSENMTLCYQRRTRLTTDPAKVTCPHCQKIAREEANQGNFIVMCRRSGGPMGFAEAPLKDGAVVVVFTDRVAAQAKADEFNRTMNRPRSLADFRYWVEEAN
jgi:hypothetical protein